MHEKLYQNDENRIKTTEVCLWPLIQYVVHNIINIVQSMMSVHFIKLLYQQACMFHNGLYRNMNIQAGSSCFTSIIAIRTCLKYWFLDNMLELTIKITQ